jgi:hypothetical protein
VLSKLSILFVGSLAVASLRPAVAQITIEGELTVHSVYRDNVIDFFDKNNIGGVGRVGEDGSHAWESQINLNFTAPLTGQVTVVAGLQGNFLWGLDDTNTITDPNGNARHNTSDDAHIELRDAYLEFREFVWPELTMTVGLQELAYDLRGDGNEFFLNTSERENRRWLDSATAANNRPANPVGAARLTSAGFGFAPSSASPAADVPHTGDGNSSTAGALKFVWDADPVFVDVFAAQLEETVTLREDHAIYGTVVDYLLAEDSLLRLSLMYIRDELALAQDLDGQTRGSIGMYQGSAGASYVLNIGNPLELYGEIGYQFGKYGKTQDLSGNIINVDQSAMAFDVGMKFTWENVTYAPWVDISYWSFTGDSNATDGDQEAWIPYGDIDDTLIFEDNRYGLGVGSGYKAIKFKTGFKPSAETSFKLVFADFNAAEDSFRTLSQTMDYRDDIGREFDAILTWDYTEDVTVKAGLGFFFSDKFLDDAVDAASSRSADDAVLFDLGLDARF